MRIDVQRLAPEVMVALERVDNPARRSGLDAGLLALVKLRVSQLNGYPQQDREVRDDPAGDRAIQGAGRA